MVSVVKGIPVECLIDGKVNVYMPGSGSLTFPARREHMKDGKPRRLEWILDPVQVETLTGPIYNKPRQITFIVAKDLLQEGQEEAMKKLVLQAGSEVFITKERFTETVMGLQKEIIELRELLKRRNKE